MFRANNSIISPDPPSSLKKLKTFDYVKSHLKKQFRLKTIDYKICNHQKWAPKSLTPLGSLYSIHFYLLLNCLVFFMYRLCSLVNSLRVLILVCCRTERFFKPGSYLSFSFTLHGSAQLCLMKILLLLLPCWGMIFLLPVTEDMEKILLHYDVSHV